MRNWKSITIIFAFILILFSARLAWNAYFSPSEQPYPIDGELDLRDIPFDDQRKVTLDGDRLLNRQHPLFTGVLFFCS